MSEQLDLFENYYEIDSNAAFVAIDNYCVGFDILTGQPCYEIYSEDGDIIGTGAINLDPDNVWGIKALNTPYRIFNAHICPIIVYKYQQDYDGYVTRISFDANGCRQSVGFLADVPSLVDSINYDIARIRQLYYL